MLLILDNYDSFTYNLVHYLEELGAATEVVRNDELTVAEALALAPERVVISPGPGGPDQAGISCALVERLAGVIPILGVCLGHQVIAQVCGGRVVRASRNRPRPGDARATRRSHALCRIVQSARGHALSLAGGRARELARVPRNIGHERGWDDHGDSASALAPRRGAVSPGIDPDHRRQTTIS